MILEFIKVSHVHDRKKQIYNLQDVNLSLPKHHNIAILAVHERSADAMVALICGIKAPTRGHITRQGSISAPLGNDEFFHRELSGEQNLQFIAKIYGQNQKDFLEKIIAFTGLKEQLKQKVKDYASPLKRKITLTASVLMDLDTYVLKKEMPQHPQALFNKKLQQRFRYLSKNSQLIIASNNPKQIRTHAQHALVIDPSGYTTFFDNIELGIEMLEQLKQDNDTDAVK